MANKMEENASNIMDNSRQEFEEEEDSFLADTSVIQSKQTGKKSKHKVRSKRLHGKAGLNLSGINGAASLNSSGMKTTLRSNNRMLARALEQKKIELFTATQTILQMHEERQELLQKLNSLESVAGLKNENIEQEVERRMTILKQDEIGKEVERRMEVCLFQIKGALNQAASNLMNTVEHIQMAMTTCGTAIGRQSSSVGSNVRLSEDSQASTVSPDGMEPTTRRSIYYTGPKPTLAKTSGPRKANEGSSIAEITAEQKQETRPEVNTLPNVNVDSVDQQSVMSNQDRGCLPPDLSMIVEQSFFGDIPFTEESAPSDCGSNKMRSRSRSRSKSRRRASMVYSIPQDTLPLAEPEMANRRSRSLTREQRSIVPTNQPSKSSEEASETTTNTIEKETETKATRHRRKSKLSTRSLVLPTRNETDNSCDDNDAPLDNSLQLERRVTRRRTRSMARCISQDVIRKSVVSVANTERKDTHEEANIETIDMDPAGIEVSNTEHHEEVDDRPPNTKQESTCQENHEEKSENKTNTDIEEIAGTNEDQNITTHVEEIPDVVEEKDSEIIGEMLQTNQSQVHVDTCHEAETSVQANPFEEDEATVVYDYRAMLSTVPSKSIESVQPQIPEVREPREGNNSIEAEEPSSPKSSPEDKNDDRQMNQNSGMLSAEKSPNTTGPSPNVSGDDRMFFSSFIPLTDANEGVKSKAPTRPAPLKRRMPMSKPGAAKPTSAKLGKAEAAKLKQSSNLPLKKTVSHKNSLTKTKSKSKEVTKEHVPTLTITKEIKNQESAQEQINIEKEHKYHENNGKKDRRGTFAVPHPVNSHPQGGPPIDKEAKKLRRGTFVLESERSKDKSKDKRGTFFVPNPVNQHLDTEDLEGISSDVLIDSFSEDEDENIAINPEEPGIQTGGDPAGESCSSHEHKTEKDSLAVGKSSDEVPELYQPDLTINESADMSMTEIITGMSIRLVPTPDKTSQPSFSQYKAPEPTFMEIESLNDQKTLQNDEPLEKPTHDTTMTSDADACHQIVDSVESDLPLGNGEQSQATNEASSSNKTAAKNKETHDCSEDVVSAAREAGTSRSRSKRSCKDKATKAIGACLANELTINDSTVCGPTDNEEGHAEEDVTKKKFSTFLSKPGKIMFKAGRKDKNIIVPVNASKTNSKAKSTLPKFKKPRSKQSRSKTRLLSRESLTMNDPDAPKSVFDFHPKKVVSADPLKSAFDISLSDSVCAAAKPNLTQWRERQQGKTEEPEKSKERNEIELEKKQGSTSAERIRRAKSLGPSDANHGIMLVLANGKRTKPRERSKSVHYAQKLVNVRITTPVKRSRNPSIFSAEMSSDSESSSSPQECKEDAGSTPLRNSDNFKTPTVVPESPMVFPDFEAEAARLKLLSQRENNQASSPETNGRKRSAEEESPSPIVGKQRKRKPIIDMITSSEEDDAVFQPPKQKKSPAKVESETESSSDPSGAWSTLKQAKNKRNKIKETPPSKLLVLKMKLKEQKARLAENEKSQTKAKERRSSGVAKNNVKHTDKDVVEWKASKTVPKETVPELDGERVPKEKSVKSQRPKKVNSRRSVNNSKKITEQRKRKDSQISKTECDKNVVDLAAKTKETAEKEMEEEKVQEETTELVKTSHRRKNISDIARLSREPSIGVDTEDGGGRKPRRAAAAAAGSLKEPSLGGKLRQGDRGTTSVYGKNGEELPPTKKRKSKGNKNRTALSTISNVTAESDNQTG